LDAVARINDALASGHPLDEIFDVICRETCTAFGVSDTVLWLAEPSVILAGAGGRQRTAEHGERRTGGVHRALVAAAAYGSHATIVSRTQATLSLPLDGLQAPEVQSFQTRRGLIANAVESSSLVSWEPHAPRQGAALLIVPLLATPGEPLGVLALRDALDPQRFDTDDLERVRLFAVQATLAIETARVHTELRVARADAEDQRARWQAAVDDLPALVCTCDRALRITYVSPTCEQMLGTPRGPGRLAEAGAVGSGFFWLDEEKSGPASLSFEELPLVRALRERRTAHNITIAHRCLDGMQRLIAWDAAPMLSARGELLGAVAFGRDVTAERRQGEREACLAAVTRAAAGAPDPDGAEGRAARIVNILVEHARVPVIAATLYLLDEESGALRRVGAFGVQKSRTHSPTLPLTRQHPWWYALMSGPAFSPHDRAQPRWLRALDPAVWKASSIRAWATVPLRIGDTLVGALAIGLSVPHIWDAAERAWIEACAAALTMGVENDHLFAAERRRSRELEAALSAATAAPDRDRTNDGSEAAGE
jgi:GAF domain-containing protein